MSAGEAVPCLRRMRFGPVCASALAMGLVLVTALWMAPAFACTVLSDIQARPSRGDPGAIVRIDGAGFELHGNPVNIFWGGETHGTLLTTVAADNGTFSVDVTIPLNAVAHSQYLIQAVQNGSGLPHVGTTVFQTLSHPVAAPVPAAPAAAPIPQPHPAAAAQAPAVPQPVPQPVHQPVAADAGGFSHAGAPAFAPGGQPVAPLSPSTGNFGGAAHPAGGPSPWILLPIGVLGLGLFSAGAAATVRQVKREGVRAPI